MNLDDYHVLFVAIILVLVLIFSSPIFSLFLQIDDSQGFSEFWLLGDQNTSLNYPLQISADKSYDIFIGGENHMGYSEYYMIRLKIRNITQSLPDVDASIPSSVNSLYDYRIFVSKNENWQRNIQFGFGDVLIVDNVLYADEFFINDLSFPIDLVTTWDPERDGYYFQLFVELWHYDLSLKSFSFHDRFVGLWLNVAS